MRTERVRLILVVCDTSRRPNCPVRMETFIRKQLAMKFHYITNIEETDESVIAHVARIGKRQLRCSQCRAACRRTHGRLKARRLAGPESARSSAEAELSP